MSTTTGRSLSNAQRAIVELRDMIISGDLAPGTDHLESELATRLDMSRTPVREAALMLESEGLLELRPRKGVRISSVSLDDMDEVYDILTELESYSARLAAERNPSKTELGPIERSVKEMDKALSQGQLEDWATADESFHRALVELGGNSRVMSIFEMMSNQVRRARAVTLYMRPVPTSSNNDHAAVIEAIKMGDGETAAAIHRSHRQNAKSLLIDLLKKYRLTNI